jgi:hypothetical protein
MMLVASTMNEKDLLCHRIFCLLRRLLSLLTPLLANRKKLYELLPKPSGKIGNAGADQVPSLCVTHHMSRCGATL